MKINRESNIYLKLSFMRTQILLKLSQDIIL